MVLIAMNFLYPEGGTQKGTLVVLVVIAVVVVVVVVVVISSPQIYRLRFFTYLLRITQFDAPNLRHCESFESYVVNKTTALLYLPTCQTSDA